MKKCSTCKAEKTELDFYFRNKAKGTRNSICKLCMKLYRRNHYDNNINYYKDKAKRNTKRRVLENKKYIWSYLKAHSCVDCGETNPIVLEFDHKDPAFKSFTIGTVLNGWRNFELLEEEVAKCDIRCSNCHKLKTAKQRGYYKWVEKDDIND